MSMTIGLDGKEESLLTVRLSLINGYRLTDSVNFRIAVRRLHTMSSP